MSSINSLFKVVFQTVSIFGKAVGQAYRQSQAQSAARKAAGISGNGVSGSFAQEYGGINVSESMDILNLKGADAKDLSKILDRYKTLSKINDPKNGGSFYIQSKVYRAAERLKYDLKMENPEEYKKLLDELEGASKDANKDVKVESIKK
ncbi:related to Mitochondrial import inner membrane translocase subunit TIM16 [Hanseniaspora guilliermondii]|uniref:Mitochondrial import inner membrane translocase subunit TIM16 n=1 Tax=Hanseniaspora guilliermondii TaxID=56406 RepID=A0A1L0CVW7_9ASCO|nr:related to Mitochondrial import inner membrane translocase subunit TIM16 [Hanseniaspora guilliermondii]